MIKPEPLDCAICGRRIGANRPHYATEAGAIVCAPCVVDPRTHRTLYPRCGSRWHYPSDHGVVSANRSGAHWITRHGGLMRTHPEVIEHKRQLQRRLLDIDARCRRIDAELSDDRRLQLLSAAIDARALASSPNVSAEIRERLRMLAWQCHREASREDG
jgi:hypothetical protein